MYKTIFKAETEYESVFIKNVVTDKVAEGYSVFDYINTDKKGKALKGDVVNLLTKERGSGNVLIHECKKMSEASSPIGDDVVKLILISGPIIVFTLIGGPRIMIECDYCPYCGRNVFEITEDYLIEEEVC